MILQGLDRTGDQAYGDPPLVRVGCAAARAIVTFVDGATASAATGCLPRMTS